MTQVKELQNPNNKKEDGRWVEERYFLYYEVPNIYDSSWTEILNAKEYLIEIMDYMIDDSKLVLTIPFYSFRFWSNVVFNSSILDVLVSFLQDALSYYALESFPNDSEMQNIFTRLVTNKESPNEYMTLYGRDNEKAVSKILNSLFTIQLLYNDDVIRSVPYPIEICLKLYDTAAVINAVLVQTLPSQLSELDFFLPYIPSDTEGYL
ncbi:hypothetical protein M0802_010744 [Mischocyttarus mexicanus]|nr:hypothetical protein M0802_010744 [Mischocyttarus mexicanus]